MSIFWYTTACVLTADCVDNEAQDNEEIIVDDSMVDQRWTRVDDFMKRSLYECPVDGCSSSFLTYAGLERHVDKGKHKTVPERVTLRDYTLNSFLRELEEVSGDRSVQYVTDAVSSLSSNPEETMSALEQGWALRTRKVAARFSDDIKDYIEECFEKGLQQKRKLNPKEVEEMIVNARRDDGSLRFSPHEYLNQRQIGALFSRIASKRRNRNHRRKRTLDDEDIETEGDLEAEYFKDAGTIYIDDEYYMSIERNKHNIFDMREEVLIDPISSPNGNQKKETSHSQKRGHVHDELFL